jgi:tetratricopeptide (TPR) repeat protein
MHWNFGKAIVILAIVLPLQVCAGQSSERANPAIAQGLALMQSGDFAGAASTFREMLQADPESPAAHYNLALALIRLHEEAEAIQELKATITLRPQFDAAHYNLAILLEESSRFRDAIEQLDAYRELRPDDPAAFVHLVHDWFKARDGNQALKLALDGLTRYSDLRVRAQLGIVLLENGQYADSVQPLEQAREAAPDSAPIAVYLARAYLGARKLDRAILLLKQSVQQFPASVDIYLMLGIAEAEQHGAAAAKPYIERGIELGPQVALGYNLLGNLNLRGGDYENALGNYRKAEDLAPENDLYSYDVALVLERMNRVAEAIPFAEKATRLNPNRDASHYLLGKLYVQSSRNAEAIRELEACVHLNPQADAPCYLLARTYMKLGQQRNAEEWSRKLGELKEAKNRRVGLAGPASESLDIQNAPQSWDKIP